MTFGERGDKQHGEKSKEWVKSSNGADVTGERLCWTMKRTIIVGVANHEPIAVLPGQKTKTYCNCLVN